MAHYKAVRIGVFTILAPKIKPAIVRFNHSVTNGRPYRAVRLKKILKMKTAD
jgi:hypothetical protein